jgi:hypothetical protein
MPLNEAQILGLVRGSTTEQVLQNIARTVGTFWRTGQARCGTNGGQGRHDPSWSTGAPFAGTLAQRGKGGAMITAELRLPELGLLAGTRALLGAGIGLLMAERLSEAQRKGIGWTLVAFGVLTTIPLALMVLDRHRVRRT